MSKLVIVGTVAFDAIETPFGKTDKILGGAATYIGLSASNFGVDAAIVSVVGGDFPKDYISMLEDKGMNVEGLEVVENGKTGVLLDTPDSLTEEIYKIYAESFKGEAHLQQILTEAQAIVSATFQAAGV